ncbi:MAG TPA: M3 family oligoendopeptidase [Clostridiaceae bacterium]|nr:M3 family oligoendopeptidase [Clostridiaceae bacterium]
MTSYPKFSELIYKPVYLNEIRMLARQGVERLVDAEYVVDILHEIQPLKEMLDKYQQAYALVGMCRNLDPSDSFYQSEVSRHFRDRRLMREIMDEVYQNILEHGDLLGGIARLTGKMPILNAHNQTAINRDHLSVEQTEEVELVFDLRQIGEVFPDLPKTLNITPPYKQPDEARMLEMIGELIEVRHNLAQQQGFPSFVEFGYRRLGYFDFDPMEAKSLRNAIVRYIVPLASEIRARLREAGGETPPDVFTASYIPWQNTGQPDLFADNSDQRSLNLLFNQVILTSMAGNSPPFWEALYDLEYIQSYNRPAEFVHNKCYRLTAPALPVIFTNRNLNCESLADYFNMAGRAYGYLCCQEKNRYFFYQDPSLATVRIWGKAMECLGYFGCDAMFGNGETSRRWTLWHMQNLLLELPLQAMIDEFQVQLFTLRTRSSEHWYRYWLRLVQRYFPDLCDDSEWLKRQASLWLSCQSTYVEPYSALSKVVAMIVGLSLWDQSRKRRAEALTAYETFCTMTFDDTCMRLLNEARISDPFNQRTIKRIAFQCASFLEL